MFIQILLLSTGFIILVKGADFFVDAASSLAENFHLPKILIALTIVAFGTSAPEFAVSIKAMISNTGDMVLGNVIGSNILNVLLILGISSIIHPLNVKNNTVKKEIPFTILITFLLAILIKDSFFSESIDNVLTRGDGMIILLFFTIFLYYLFTISKKKENKKEEIKPKYNMLLSIIFTFIGIVFLVFGSNTVVDAASSLAKLLGISDLLIALTIVALGTSLPELITSVVATKKGEYDIAIGNVVGSNIFNIGIVLGIPLTIFGRISNITLSSLDLIIMLIAECLLFIFSYKNLKISRMAGITFLILFLIYYGNLIFSFF